MEIVNRIMNPSQQPELAPLSGTEKQIKGAEEIRTKLLASIESLRSDVPVEHRHILDGALAWYASIEDAKFFIELQTYLLSDAFTAVQAVMTLDRQSGQVPFAQRCRMHRLTIPILPKAVADL
jgi:hypothetical protein